MVRNERNSNLKEIRLSKRLVAEHIQRKEELQRELRINKERYQLREQELTRQLNWQKC